MLPHSRYRATAGWWLAIWLLVLPCLPGCGGCVSSQGTSEKERNAKREELKKKEKPKENFEFLRFSTWPSEPERLEVGIKQGHWTTGMLEIRANNFDFRGELATDMTNARQQPVPLDQMPYLLRSSRPAILPKGQKRLLEFPLFAPVELEAKQAATELLYGRGGRVAAPNPERITCLPAHQYYFVVLAANPDPYRFLVTLDAIRFPTTDLVDTDRQAHYRVILPRIRGRAPLPAAALSWTMIAYVLWDDLEPKKLAPEQQTALLDWLHWGGQLIVSGPETLDTLRGSFLEGYLPAEGDGTWSLTPEQGQSLNDAWNLTDRPLKVVQPWAAVSLKPHAAARTLLAAGDKPLLVERQIGLGRIVLSAFRLSQRELVSWPSYDGMVNNCILRRPPRRFIDGQDATLQALWADGHPALDPKRISAVRYFTRDGESAPDQFKDLRERPPPAPRPPDEFAPFDPLRQSIATSSLDGPPIGSGVAGWNDFSAPSDLARGALREAAGIVVPDAMFVVWILAVYVTVLVPLNWGLFRLIGRVEWAWAAAPAISVACSVAVVYLAQLDIGFARSKTELAILEMHAEYPRAHLTRYTALYSSLGASYDLRFEDDTALALPFPSGKAMLRGAGSATVEFRRARESTGKGDESTVSLVTLEGMEINSNTTGMVHSEQMYEVGGAFRWEPLGNGRFRLVNGTRLALQGAAIVGESQAAWLGDLRPGASVEVELADRPQGEAFGDRYEALPTASSKAPAEGLNLRRLLQLAQQQIPTGELRLVAWTDEELAGLEIKPEASQSRQLGLLISHLKYPDAPDPKRDTNTRADVEKASGRLPQATELEEP